MSLEFQTKLDETEHYLTCLYCSGRVKPLSAQSKNFQFLQCVECEKLQLIFKTDYLEFLGGRK